MEEPDFLFNAEAFDGASASAAKEVEELLSDMDSGLFFNDAGSWANGMPHNASANTGAGGNPGPKAASGASSNNSVAMMAEAAEQFTLGGLPEPPTGQKQQQPPQPQQPQQQQPAPPAPSQAGIMAPPSSFAMAPASSETNKSLRGLSAGFAAPPLWKGSGGGTGASGGAEDAGGPGAGAGAGSTAMEQGGLRSRSESFNALMDETGSILSSDSSIWGLDSDAGSNVIPPQYQMFTGLGGGAGAGGPAASFIMPSSPAGVSAASRSSLASSVSSVGGGGALRRRALGAKGLGGVEAQLLRGGETSLGPVKRKQDRNAREQKRSLKISQQIGHLKDVLEEDGKKVKNSKMAILVSVQEYIRELESQISVLQLSRNSALGQQPQQPQQAQQQAGGPGKGEDGGGGSVGGSGGDGVAALMLPPPALTMTSKKSAAMSSVSSASGEDAMTAAGVEGASGVDYQSLFHQVSTPLAVAGVDGRFVDANARFQMATGYSKEELGKLTLFNLVCPEDLQETFGTVARMLNEPGAGESRFTRRALPKQRSVGLGSGERQRPQPLFVTISLVRQNGVPQFFQCSLH